MGAVTGLLMAVALALAAAALYRVARLAHAAEAADWGRPVLNRLDGLNRLLCRRYHRLPEVWLPLPAKGPALVASNHVSGLDPLLLIAASRRPLRFIIAREQYERRGLSWLFQAIGCIPVDRGTRPELALRAALRALRAGEVVALFPHGRIHLDRDPPRPLKAGVAWLARQAGCPVVPARIEGVRAEGHVVLAPLARSLARIRTFPPLGCTALPTEDCLARLAAAIEAGPPPETGGAGARQP
jgi:1-acyl-sn-glycerol-3-phosphate acyltransferase